MVVDRDWYALLFSREPIPNLRDVGFQEIDAFKQVCIMPFWLDSLFKYITLEETPLVVAESIDMLRLLEHGFKVKIKETSRDIHAVDTKEDHLKVANMMLDDDLRGHY